MVSRSRPSSGAQQRGHAPACIAAGAHLRAVGVQNSHEHIGSARRLQHDDLIAARSFRAAGNRACHRVRTAATDPARASIMTKSLPRPFIFLKGMCRSSMSARALPFEETDVPYIAGGRSICKERVRPFQHGYRRQATPRLPASRHFVQPAIAGPTPRHQRPSFDTSWSLVSSSQRRIASISTTSCMILSIRFWRARSLSSGFHPR